MSDLPQSMLHGGVSIDIAFAQPSPRFGDLLGIGGATDPQFPPIGSFRFQTLAHLKFTWEYDRFENNADDGTEVVVRLYPLRAGAIVGCSRNPKKGYRGPLSGVRLDYPLQSPVTARKGPIAPAKARSISMNYSHRSSPTL